MVGIGAGGQLGFAAEVLPAPIQSALATSASGGTITAGTYRYVLTAINAFGETIASNEQTIVTTGSTSTVTVSWAAVTGATGYKLYKTAAGGATGTELLYKTVGAVITDIDTSPGSPSGAFPTFNTANNYGTYVAPTKFTPIMSENLHFIQETNFRRPIRKSADIVGANAGNVHTEGDIEMEALEDVVVHFLYASRVAVVKTGTPNFTYTITPTAAAVPVRSMSITVERAGVVFGYTGCVVASFRFTITDGTIMFNCSILGSDEAVQSLPVPTWPATVPFGAGQYDVQIPTATTVFDTDTFEWTCDDNAEPQYRMKTPGRGAQFIAFGERSLGLTVERDFETRTDYDAFKALTAQSITFLFSKGANNQISLVTPVSIKDTYELGLSGQGDLIRASIQYQMAIDGSGNSFTIVVKTQENVT
jgi:tail tube protein